MTPAEGTLAFIINPTAGGGRARRVWERLARQLEAQQVPYTGYMTEGPGHAQEVAAEGLNSHRALIAVGGDGTLHEVINGAGAPNAVPLGLIPCGTGNDFARSAGLPRQPEAALAAVLAGREHQYDVGRANETLFVNVAGVGFDAAVAARVNGYRYWKRGNIPYLWAILSELRQGSGVPVSLQWGGAPAEPAQIFMVAVGNGNQYAGGMKICPDARPDDGMLDICLVQDISRLEALRMLPKVFSGAHLTHPNVELRRAQGLAVSGSPDVYVHADGEVIGRLPVTFSVLPGVLRFLVPASLADAR